MTGGVARDRCSNRACVLPCVHVDPPGHELTVAVALVGYSTALDPGQLLGEGETRLVSIVVFQAGDGTFGAVPADEIDGDEVQVVAEVDPWA